MLATLYQAHQANLVTPCCCARASELNEHTIQVMSGTVAAVVNAGSNASGDTCTHSKCFKSSMALCLCMRGHSRQVVVTHLLQLGLVHINVYGHCCRQSHTLSRCHIMTQGLTCVALAYLDAGLQHHL